MMAYDDNVNQDTTNQITNWVGSNYGAPAASSSGPLILGAPPYSSWMDAANSAPAASSSPAPTSTWANVAAPAAQPVVRSASGTSGGQVRPADTSTQQIPDAPAWVSPNLTNTSTSSSSSPATTAPASSTPASSTPSTNLGSNVNTSAPGATATPVTIDPATLAVRTVDPATETVAGQVNKLLAENSPVLQQAQAAAQRQAADRGMLNTAMAAGAGTDALIKSATTIGGADASTYSQAANYNAAATNQALMQNTTNAQQLQQTQLQLQDSAAARAQALLQTQLQLQDAAAARAQALAISQMQDATSRYQSEMSANTTRYTTDKNYQEQMNAQKETLVNQIINNMDLSPDRKAALLEQLGEGTSANAATGSTGSGLAGAVYVIGSTAADLTSGTSSSSSGNSVGVNGGVPYSGTGSTSGLTGLMNNVAGQVRYAQR
jgi:hypothetical protein